ncbi:hypothetical protein L950_0216545 [Sphingobacterium sp. IITKGP-BTPF85]|nr:hypothetical protein L950_0216545 [Sphingobacterium sp. IITKGP-BTPF85]
MSAVTYFFMQNEESVHLLKEHGFRNVGLTGDTRFDRVVELPKQRKQIDEVTQFVAEYPVLVAGSTWQEDEQLLKDLMLKFPKWKLILAPHEIHDTHIRAILALFPDALQFSKYVSYADERVAHAQVLIIDNIGMLSSLYGYGKMSYIGGGFGIGIHNTLEAATYGIPVIFGPKYHKFQEAKDLIEQGAGFSIQNREELYKVFTCLQDSVKREYSGKQAKCFVQQHAGATAIIMKYLYSSKLLK